LEMWFWSEQNDKMITQKPVSNPECHIVDYPCVCPEIRDFWHR